MIKKEEVYKIGRIGKPHGVHGELQLQFSDDKIVAVDETTVNTLFEVSTPEGEEILIPATDELIVATDIASQTITMRIPAGLLDL